MHAVTDYETRCLQDDAANARASKSADYLALRTSVGLPRYLSQRRSWWMSYGRSIKTKLRCGTSELEIERGRYDSVPRDQRRCRCCTTGAVECSFHYLMRCPLHSRARAQFFTTIDTFVRSSRDHFGWSRMSPVERWRFLLGDGPPSEPADFVTGSDGLNRMQRRCSELSPEEQRGLIYGGDTVTP